MEGVSALKNPRTLFELLKETYHDWSEDKASRLAAALAYYTAFTVAPLILISIVVAGLVFGKEAAQGQIFEQLNGTLGPEAAGTVQTAVAGSQKSGASTLSAIIGIVTLIWSASGLFSQLQDALDTIWEVQPDPTAGWMAFIKRRFFSMTMVLGVGFLLLVSLVLSTAITAIGTFLGNTLPGGAVIWQAVNFVISFGIITLLFAAIFKVLPDATIDWSDVWFGAAATALLFTIGKLLIGLYLGYASVGSTFGAAGSLLVFLVWVYYSAQILLFGAELTQVYARKYGSRIMPAEGAISVTEEVRANEGTPHTETLQRAAAKADNREPALAGAPATGTSRRAAANWTGYSNGAVHKNGKAHTNGVADSHGKAQVNSKAHPKGDGGTSGAPDAVKKVLWAGLVSGSLALGTIAARRASTEIWRVIVREDPPTKDV
jgi:membrane protein